MNILIGADPELFVKRAGEFISGFNLIPGTKDKPHRVENGAVQVDGMALEFNIDPAATEDDFLNNINSVVAQMAQMVPDCELEAVPVVEFGADYIKAQPHEAQELGCDPDFNAYHGGANHPPDVDMPIRTGAGHVHIGWGEDFDVKDYDHLSSCHNVIQQLDVALGLPSLFMDRCDERRKMYGKAGAFRPKPYGCEYRVLSNFWTKNPDTIRWVFSQTKKALDDLANGNFYGDAFVEEIINSNNRREAQHYLYRQGLWEDDYYEM